MGANAVYLRDIGQLADRLAREFASLSYETFAQDTDKIESAVLRLAIMKDGWAWLSNDAREELALVDWRPVTGKWDWQAHRHVGVDAKQLWETVQKLPQLSRKVEELLARGSETFDKRIAFYCQP